MPPEGGNGGGLAARARGALRAHERVLRTPVLRMLGLEPQLVEVERQRRCEHVLHGPARHRAAKLDDRPELELVERVVLARLRLEAPHQNAQRLQVDLPVQRRPSPVEPPRGLEDEAPAPAVPVPEHGLELPAARQPRAPFRRRRKGERHVQRMHELQVDRSGRPQHRRAVDRPHGSRRGVGENSALDVQIGRDERARDRPRERDEPDRERDRKSHHSENRDARRRRERGPEHGCAARQGGDRAGRAPLGGGASTAQQEQCGKPGDDRCDPRRAQLLDLGARTRKPNPLFAEQLARAHVLGIEEAVVVPLERVPVPALGDDPVQHVAVQLEAVVADDLANPVRRPTAEHDQVAAVEVGLHARAVDDRVRRPAAELRRGQEEPEGRCAGEERDDR